MSPDEINQLVALFQSGHHAELESQSRLLVGKYPESGMAWKALAASLRVQGKDALAALQKVTCLLPGDAEEHFNLANALHDLGQLDAAAASYRRAVEIKPDYLEAHSNLGVLLKDMGRLDEAETSYRRALQINSNYAEIHCNLGDILTKLGRLEEAEASLRRSLEINNNYAESHNNLGNVLRGLRKLDDAVDCYRRALEITPDYLDAHSNLSVVLQEQGRLDEAEACLRRALVIKPNFAEVHNNLGKILRETGQLEGAVKSFRRALELNPEFIEAHNNLGVSLKEQDRFVEAEACYRRALELKHDYAETHNNLAVLFKDAGRFEEAEATYRQALQINPNYAEIHCNLGDVIMTLGRLSEAEVSFRRALEIKPGLVTAHSNLIFSLDITSDIGIPALQSERKKWAEAHADALLQAISHSNEPEPERRLRIGYVSADFWMHSATSAFGSMLMSYDRSRFDVIAYSNTAKEDQLTQRFRQSVTCWRKIAGLSDDAVADLIRQDGIDILVDLSGFSAGNRLLVFARKPAPIQVTAWGYPSGTGMGAMDVLFSDPVIIPPEEQQHYTEQIRYLPCTLTYFSERVPPSVNELPSLENKRITFGSFNRLAKISDEAYRTWAQVLQAVPASRMILKTGELSDAVARARVIAHFTGAGVAAERITLLGRTSWQEHMAAFNRVDISLDPFPQGGGVTTMESLLMGVPVVTLYLPIFAGRVGASILTTLGLDDWIAETPEQYIEIAVRKAQGISALAELRLQLRSRFMTSALGDTDAYIRAAEQEYRQLWREWCGRQEFNR